MHVTIAQIVNQKKQDAVHYDEDEVLNGNENLLDYVTEHTDEERDEAIRDIIEWLSPCINHGTEVQSGKEVHWFEIDKARLNSVFDKYYAEFEKQVRQLHADCTPDNFITGTDIGVTLCRLKDTYHFDWLYVLDESGDLNTVADWLRYIKNEPDGETPARWYIHATYNAHQ